MHIDECDPTQEHPRIVQEFVEGTDASTFSIVRDGKVLVHGVYEPLIESTGWFSVRFSSIDDFGTLPVAMKVAEYFGYTGFLCFDRGMTRFRDCLSSEFLRKKGWSSYSESDSLLRYEQGFSLLKD